jgi:hypothetical protein
MGMGRHCGMTRRCQTTSPQLEIAPVAISGGGAARSARRHTMSSSERIQQISNHLSNNYSRGLLSGDVAIITGTVLYYFSLAPALRFIVTNSPQALRRYDEKKAIWPSHRPSKRGPRSHRESVEVRPSSSLRKAQRSSLASKGPPISYT